MKKLALIAALSALALPAAAQQPEDQKAASYRTLLTEANDRVASLNAAAIGLQNQIKAITAERDKLAKELAEAKAPAKPAPASP